MKFRHLLTHIQNASKLMLCCLFMFFSTKSLLGQLGSTGATPPSGSNINEGDFQLSNNGMYFLNNPLFDLPLSSEYVLKAGLGYATRSFKVQEIASEVGLGWESSLDNRIYRIVNGLPDNFDNNNYGSKLKESLSSDGKLDFQTLTKIKNRELDGEPDIFVLKINGQSHRFVINKDKDVVWLNERNYTVLNNPFKREMGLTYWLIVDLKGNKYVLGNDAASIEENSIINKEKNITAHFYESEKSVRFTSAWVLNSIQPFDSNDITTFEYESVGVPEAIYYNILDGSQKIYNSKIKMPIYLWGFKIRDYSNTTNVEDVKHTIIKITKVINHSPKYLKKIVSPYGNVTFAYNTRKDFKNGRCLKSIDINDKTGILFKRIKLNYFYTHQDESNNLYTHLVPDLSAEKYRLMLENVVEEFPSGDTLKNEEYIYNIGKPLPPRYSSKVDHWGYHNNNKNGFDMSNTIYLPYNKSADFTTSLSNTLQSVLYKTGGSVSFEYESHDYYSDSLRYNMTVGGVRVREIRNGDIDNKIISTMKFSYRNQNDRSTGMSASFTPLYEKYLTNPHYVGVLDNGLGRPSNIDVQTFVNNIQSNLPAYSSFIYTQVPGQTNGMGGGVVKPWMADVAIGIGRLLFDKGESSTYGSPTIIISFSNFNSNFQQTSVEYSAITTTDGNGKIVREYTDRKDFPDYSFQAVINPSYFNVLSLLYPNEAPYTPVTSYAFARGKLKKVQYLNNNNQILREQKYFYKKSALGNNDILNGFLVEDKDLSNHKNIAFGSSKYAFGHYQIIDSVMQLTSIEDKYYGTDGSLFNAQQSRFEYVDKYPSLLKRLAIKTSNGDSTVTSNYYVINKNEISLNPENLLINSLYANSSFGHLVKAVTVTNQSLKSKETIFKSFGSRLLPSFDKLTTNTTVENTDEISRYDENGNVLEIKKRNGSADSYLYAYNGTYKVAEIKDLNYEVLENGTPQIGQLKLSWDNQHIDNTLSAVQQAFPKSKMERYTYRPYVGLATKMDIRGRMESYEYDRFNRLELIKDHDGNILKSMCYSYRWVPVNCSDGKIMYSNRRIVKEFLNSSCFPEQIPQKAAYTVPEGKYFSAISQADADNKAMQDVNLNGQNYVNSITGCDRVMVKVPITKYTGWEGSISRIQFFNGLVKLGEVYPLNTGNSIEDEIIEIPAGIYTRVSFDIDATNTSYEGYLSFINGNATRVSVIAGTHVMFDLNDVHVDPKKDNRIVIAEYGMN